MFTKFTDHIPNFISKTFNLWEKTSPKFSYCWNLFNNLIFYFSIALLAPAVIGFPLHLMFTTIGYVHGIGDLNVLEVTFLGLLSFFSYSISFVSHELKTNYDKLSPLLKTLYYDYLNKNVSLEEKVRYNAEIGNNLTPLNLLNIFKEAGKIVVIKDETTGNLKKVVKIEYGISKHDEYYYDVSPSTIKMLEKFYESKNSYKNLIGNAFSAHGSDGLNLTKTNSNSQKQFSRI